MDKSKLWEIRNIDAEIENLIEKYEALRLSLLPSAIRYDKDKVQTSPQDTMSEIASQLVDIENQIIEKKRKRAFLIDEIYEKLESLESEREQTILIKYFIGRKSLRAIAYDIGMSKSAVHKIYKKALSKI